MDPLSEVLSLLKPRSYASRGFGFPGEMSIQWPKHSGIKCYAVLSGHCWLTVEGVADPVELVPGDCFLLPRGRPFCLTTDLALKPIDFQTILMAGGCEAAAAHDEGARNYIAGGHFILSGRHAEMLLESLPPIVHIRKEEDKAAMRWSLERMKVELHEPQPGGTLIAQQLAYMMLIQALRLHLTEGAKGSVGWLFALADKQMSAAIACMHEAPGHPWTLQEMAERVAMSRSVFAQKFKDTVGVTPMEYLTRWRMVLAADRMENSGDSIAEIAPSLGYESESAFGKAFRRVMGCSPRQYCRSRKNEPEPMRVNGMSPSYLMQQVATT